MSKSLLPALALLLFAIPAQAGPPDTYQDWSSIGPSSHRYGSAIATAGDVNGDGYSDVIVGAPDFSFQGGGQGRVYLHYGSADGPSEDADWSYFPNANGSDFGYSVSPAGDTNGDGFDDFLVGAPTASHGHVGEGRVYLFGGGASGPSLLQTFEMDETLARFGHCVAWAGDVNGDGYDDILAGAPEWGGFGSPFYIPVQGAVRLYHGGPGIPDDTPDWSKIGGQTSSQYGFSVSGIGDVNNDGYMDVMVGAPSYDPGIIDTNIGKVFAYLGSASGLSSAPFYERIGPSNGAKLGYSVAALGDTNADGYADCAFSAPFANPRVVYVAKGAIGGLSLTPQTFSSVSNTGFGVRVSSAGDINGDGHADMAVGTWSNSAFIYVGTPVNMQYCLDLSSGAFTMGEVVASAGDVNSDGMGDVIVYQSYFGSAESIVRVYHGGRTAPETVFPRWDTSGTEVGDELGASVDGVGDLDGDGYDDVVFGAPGAGPNGEGSIRIYYSTTVGVSEVRAEPRLGSGPGSRFGEAVSGAGDVNGDGYMDIVVGEPGTETVHVFHGSPTGPSATPDWSYQWNQPGSEFGAAVDGGGDVNGDGYADIIVGGPHYEGTFPDQGLMCVFFGSASGITSAGAFSQTIVQSGARMGSSVAMLGDVHGDGYDDVAAGAPGYDLFGLVDRGGVYMYSGEPGGVDYLAWATSGISAGAAFGTSVAGVGDTNGDGFADMAVGAPLHDDGAIVDRGYVLLLLGDDLGLPFSTKHTIVPLTIDPSTHFGESVAAGGNTGGVGHSDILIASRDILGGRIDVYGFRPGLSFPRPLTEMFTAGPAMPGAVASAGDIDDDGWADIVYGARTATSGGTAWLFSAYDPSARSYDRHPRLRRTTGEPVPVRGRVEVGEDLELSLQLQGPTGRARVRLEWQIAEGLDPFASIESTPWMASGLAGLPNGIPITAGITTPLASGERYRWRMRGATSHPFFPKSPWVGDAPNTSSLYGFAYGSNVTAIEPAITPSVVANARLDAPYPNPFNPSTTLRLRLAETAEVRLDIFDLAGRRVSSVHEGELEAGVHEFTWKGMDGEGKRVASGVYLAVLRQGEERSSQKLMLVK